ncbi:GNAT family N-acetyltransferase [Nesterenkonia ebinurensis]|uniref:GNAT family N-acetyltransferase n=1 Tax=Nesterenkonia ebinurensis TaxID=2608252 RepID=UPI00168AEBBF|nr:GNAT family N-acetyltransferase [Nesterenkonia ebinurensis]
MLKQMVIREPETADAERIAVAHSIAAREAYGHYFPREWMLARNTPERRTEQWTEQLATYARGDSGWRIRIAEDGDKVLGFGIFGRPRDEDAPAPQELHRLYVLSEAYGTGLATRLLQALNPEPASSSFRSRSASASGDSARWRGSARLNRAYLWVMENNPRAIAFYRKHGYTPDGTLKRLENIGGHRILRMVQKGNH